MSWLLNEGCGERAFDSSGNGNHGTLVNMPSPPTADCGWGAGPRGVGLRFDGSISNSYVNCGNTDFTSYSAMTFAMWIAIDNIPGNYFIFSSYYGGSDDIRWGFSNNILYVTFDDGVADDARITTLSWSNGEWHHIAVTESNANGTLILYVDGVEVDRVSSGANFNYAGLDNVTYIGKRTTGTARNLLGSIDCFRIYNRALNANEIQWLYRDEYALFAPIFSPGYLFPPSLANPRSYGYVFG